MGFPDGVARFRVAACVALAVSFAAAAASAADPAAGAAPVVQVHQGDGTVTSGRLVGIGATEVRLADVAGDAPAIALPVERVRTVRLVDRPADGGRKALLTLVDGSTLSGDEFMWDGKRPVELVRPEGRVEIPAERVRSVALLQDAAAGAGASRWQAAIPEGTSSDLVVVGTEDSHEFVECAITAVSPETVTVILDEETIPVKRAKVIGMHWLRPTEGALASPGRLAVSVAGGVVRGNRVEWTADGLVVDGEIRLPAAMLAGIDYASGRTVGLAGVVAEKVTVEPWFGALGRGDGLEAFFAPRAVSLKGGAAAAQGAPVETKSSLLMRPRTVATWRLPADSRRLRTVVAPARGAQAADPVVVMVAVDDRELFRRQIDASTSTAADGGAEESTGIPIDLDLTGGRRLTVTVDFGSAGGIGGAVVFIEPLVER